MERDAKSDDELLTRYRRGAEECQAAFAEIVTRHGGMVFHTCFRILRNRVQAEDAAQATFVVFAQKARPGRGSMEGFLHRIAVNVAKRARDAERVRRERERGAAREAGIRRASRVDSAAWEEVKSRLDEAIERLPRMQRAALTMYYLEGRQQSQVASALGTSRNAVNVHLQRAREKLHAMLKRHSGGLSVAVLAGLLAERSSEVVCPTFLKVSAGKLAASSLVAPEAATATGAATTVISSNVTLLAKGAIKMMFWSKLKTAACVLAVASTVATGVPLAVNGVRAEEAGGQIENTAGEKGSGYRVVKVLPDGKAVLSAGSAQGVKKGSTFDVTRNGKHIGAVRVLDLGEKQSTCQMIPASRQPVICPACAKRLPFMDRTGAPGKCAGCNKATQDAMYKYCRACSGTQGRCRLCGKPARDPTKMPVIRVGDQARLRPQTGQAQPRPQALPPTKDGPLIITNADNGKTLTAGVGQTIRIQLKGDKGKTGWERGFRPKVLERVKVDAETRKRLGPTHLNDFIPADGAAKKEAGTYVFLFKAVREGKEALRFVYVYPSGPIMMPRTATRLVSEFEATVKVVPGGSARDSGKLPTQGKLGGAAGGGG